MKENLFFKKKAPTTRIKDAEEREFEKLLKRKKEMYDKKENMYKQNELMNEIYRMFKEQMVITIEYER
jgi:hypothetical protein